jgi:hypothetical protein
MRESNGELTTLSKGKFIKSRNAIDGKTNRFTKII